MHLSSSHSMTRQRWHFGRSLLVLMICAMINLSVQIAWAAPSAQSAAPTVTTAAGKAAGGGVTWKVCKTNQCFKTQEAKDKWAQDNQCRFLEDVCSQYTPAEDNAGAQAEDQGFWGSLWDDIQGAVVYGYEFVKGLFAGLKGQVEDLVHLITEFDDVVMGLVQLGKAFYEDPKGTMAELATLLGQEAADTITQATQCGAYDLGQVIGSYVSPAFALKLASKMTKYSGKLADASKALKHEYRCASFGAGTMIMTSQGQIPIESISMGQEVSSRNEYNFVDKPQVVTNTYSRIAPGYRLLKTDVGALRVTAEHPLWVQGKGWTEAANIAADDVIAGANGDVLVQANESVASPLRVYNFGVKDTHNYFAGPGIWAHNSQCYLISQDIRDLKAKERGFRGEYEVYEHLTKNGYKPVGRSFDPMKSPTIEDAFKDWDGQTGIDGIYVKDGKYVIVESKATGGTKNSDPEGCVAKLCNTQTGRQMSNEWILDRLDKIVDEPDLSLIKADLTKPGGSTNITKVYAQTDHTGSSYHVIKDDGYDDVEIGGVWNP